MHWVRASYAGVIALAVTACASNPAQNCQTGNQPAILDALYFGTAKPGGTVTPEEWNLFLNRAVTPRFPQGLTAWQAAGQWQSATGESVREETHVLHITHPDTEDTEQAIRAVIAEYKTMFQQEAVLRIRSSVCISL